MDGSSPFFSCTKSWRRSFQIPRWEVDDGRIYVVVSGMGIRVWESKEGKERKGKGRKGYLSFLAMEKRVVFPLRRSSRECSWGGGGVGSPLEERKKELPVAGNGSNSNRER